MVGIFKSWNIDLQKEIDTMNPRSKIGCMLFSSRSLYDFNYLCGKTFFSVITK